MEKTNKKNWIVSGLLVLAFVFGLFTFLGVKSPEQKVYATDTFVAGSELKIETIKGGKHSTTFAGGKYLHLDPIDKNHYTNSVSANADMEYDETTGVLKIFYTENTHNNFRGYISIIATNTTDKKLTIKTYIGIDLSVLDFPHGDLTITNGEDCHNVWLDWSNKLVMTGKLTICGEIDCSAVGTAVGLYPESTSRLSADELEILDSASLSVYPDYNTYTCGVNVRYLTLNTDGYLYINAKKNTNNSFTYVLYVAYQVNFTKCLYMSLCSPLNTVASITNSSYFKNAVNTAPIEGYVARINHEKTGQYGDFGEDLYRKELFLGRKLNVSYNSNGGSGTMSSELIVYSDNLQLPACTFTAPQGKQFAGWAVGSVDKTPLKQANDKVVITESITIYATWEDIPTDELTGTVAINGTLKYNEVLTASLTDTNNTGTLSYQWRRNGENIVGATDSSYEIAEADIGYTISVVVTSSVESGFLVGTATDVIQKAENTITPTWVSAMDCTTEANNDGQLKGTSIEMEYKLSTDENWTAATGATIYDLIPGTYNVRYKEKSTHYASQAVNVVVNAYNAPVLYGITVVDGGASVLSAGAGTTITITADEAPSGYVFDKWTSADGVVFTDENNATTTFVLPSKAVTITATYKLAEVEPETKGGLSAGAVVAIVLSSLIVLGVGGFAVYWFVIKKKTWADFTKATKDVWNKFINLFKKKK